MSATCAIEFFARMNAESKQQQNQGLNRRFTSKTGLTAASGSAKSLTDSYVSHLCRWAEKR
jgi:hypothetical protein